MIEPMSERPELVLTWRSVPFLLVHVAALGVLGVPFSWGLVALALGTYALRMFGVTGGYHRYFSHRSFKTGRAFQLVLALVSTTAPSSQANHTSPWHLLSLPSERSGET